MEKTIQPNILTELISSEFKMVEAMTRTERARRSQTVDPIVEFDELLSDPEVLEVFVRLRDK